MRYADVAADRARWRSTLSYRLHRRVQVGVEFNPVVAEAAPLATLFLVTEEERRPALFLGTSSDRIGSPEGTQAVYLTAAKYLPFARLAPYVSLNYSGWDDAVNVPFGAGLELGGGVYVRPMYDGERTHLMAGWFGETWGASLLWVWLEDPGISFTLGW